MIHTVELQLLVPLRETKKKMIKLEKFEVGILLITNKELYFYHLPFLYIKLSFFFLRIFSLES